MRFLFPLTIDCHGLLYNSTGTTKINFGNFDNYWASVFWKPQTSCYETLCVLRTTFFLSATWQPCCQLRAPTKGTATSLVQLSNVNHCIMLIFARSGGHREPYNEVGSWNLEKASSRVWTECCTLIINCASL